MGLPVGIAFTSAFGQFYASIRGYCSGVFLYFWLLGSDFVTKFKKRHPFLYRGVVVPAKLVYSTLDFLLFKPIVGILGFTGRLAGGALNYTLAFVRTRRAAFLLAGFVAGVTAGVGYALVRRKYLRNKHLKAGRLESKSAFIASVGLCAKNLASVAFVLGAGVCLIDSTLSLAAAIPYATIYNIIDRIFSKSANKEKKKEKEKDIEIPLSTAGLGFVQSDHVTVDVCSAISPCCLYRDRCIDSCLMAPCDCKCHVNYLMNSKTTTKELIEICKVAFPKEDDDYIFVKYARRCLAAVSDLIKTLGNAILSPKGLALMFSVLGFVAGALFVIYYKDLKAKWQKKSKKAKLEGTLIPEASFDASLLIPVAQEIVLKKKSRTIPDEQLVQPDFEKHRLTLKEVTTIVDAFNKEGSEEDKQAFKVELLKTFDLEDDCPLEAKGKNKGGHGIKLKNPSRNIKTAPSMMHRVRTYAGILTPPDMKDMNPEDFERTTQAIESIANSFDHRDYVSDDVSAIDTDMVTDIIGAYRFGTKNSKYLSTKTRNSLDFLGDEIDKYAHKVGRMKPMDHTPYNQLRAISEYLDEYDRAFARDEDSLESKLFTSNIRRVIAILAATGAIKVPDNIPSPIASETVPIVELKKEIDPILLEKRMPVVPKIAHCWLCKKTDHKYTHCSIRNSSKKWHFVPMSLVTNKPDLTRVQVIDSYGYLYDNTIMYYNWVTKTLDSMKDEGSVAGKSLVSVDDCYSAAILLYDESGNELGNGYIAHNYLVTARHIISSTGVHVRQKVGDKEVLLKLEDAMPPEPLRTLFKQKDSWCYRNPALRAIWKCGVSFAAGDYITIPAYMDGQLFVSQGKILTVSNIDSRCIITHDAVTDHGFSGAPILHNGTSTIIGHHVSKGDLKDVNVGEGLTASQVAFLKAPMTKKNLN